MSRTFLEKGGMNALTPRCYLTLRCDLDCAYCSNGHDLACYKELPVIEWVKLLRMLGTDDVCLTGGEPTMYADFYMLLAHLSHTHHVTIYSNFTRPLTLGSMPTKWAKGVRFRASCHAQTADEAERWLANVQAAEDGGYKPARTTVNCPPNVLEVLRKGGIVVDVPQAMPTPVAPPVSCTLDRRYFAPDGTRYHCVGKLVTADASGIVGNEDPATVICETPDRCALCDGVAARREAILEDAV